MQLKMKKKGWIFLGVIALLIRWIFSFSPQLTESLYSRGLFLGIRWCIDYMLAWLPVPLIYLFVLSIGSLIIWKTWTFFKWKASWRLKLRSGLMSLLAFLGGGIFFFLFLWGYNYSRVPIEDQLSIDPEPLTMEELWEELQLETRHITKLRNDIDGAGEKPLDDSYMPPEMERLLRKSVERWLKEYGFPTVGRVRGRFVYPKGIFLHFSSSGLYFPFTGEGHVDAGLHPLQQPYVMAHELCHGYGFGDEGTCNFLAYLSCLDAEDPFVQYAVHLAYWRTLASNYLRYDAEKYRAFRAELPAGIQADLDAINENLRQYPDIMPRFRYYAYDAYLKAQGIKEGMKNYSRVIMLVRAWRESKRI